jgi:probable rRNA maturation factor
VAHANKDNFTLINETRESIPRVSFVDIKNEILGVDYELTLVVTSPEHVKKLNTIYRDKEESTDILSFPLSENEGEMYISPEDTRRMAPDFDRPYENFFAFLFIHGCTHLKGHDHGDIMEGIEAKVREKFGI